MKTGTIFGIILALLVGYVIGNYWPLFNLNKPEVQQPTTTKTKETAAPAETATTKLPTKAQYPDTSSDTIVLSSVKQNSLIQSPLLLSGAAVAFENQFTARLEDANGKEILETPVYADSPDAGEFGKFNQFLVFENPATSTGTLELFEQDAASGKETGKVTVKVKF